MRHVFHLFSSVRHVFQLRETCLSLVRHVSPFQLDETCVSPFSIPGSNTAYSLYIAMQLYNHTNRPSNAHHSALHIWVILMKVYIEGNNMQVELIRFRKISPLFAFTFAKQGIQRDRRVYAWKVITGYACSIVISLIIRDKWAAMCCAPSSHRESFTRVHVQQEPIRL